mmetsp:Transcript_33787/g.47158  ORF Transcript_33787/g.47158 Transcript_33787/m.47158 type:complete len:94 (+) Transcript_33787:129-410(+)
MHALTNLRFTEKQQIRATMPLFHCLSFVSGLTALDLANRNNHTDVLHFLNNNETTSKTRENTLKKIEQQVEGTENDPKETAEKIREKKDDRAG